MIITKLKKNLIGPYPFWGNKPKKFDLIHQTASHQEARTSWVQDYKYINTSKL